MKKFFLLVFLFLGFVVMADQTEIIGVPGSQTWNTKLFDLDKNGADDIFIFSQRAQGIYIWLGGERLQESINLINAEPDIFISGQSVSDIIVADMDGDARNEIVISSWINNQVVIVPFEIWDENNVFFLNDPDNIIIEGDVLFAKSMAVGDFDNNGFNDLAIGGPHDWNYPGRTLIFKGRTQWSFQMSASDADLILYASDNVDYFGGKISASDINGDGFQDLIVGAEETNKAYFYYGSEIFFKAPIKPIVIESDKNFGSAVAAKDNILLIGSIDDNQNSMLYGFYGNELLQDEQAIDADFKIKGQGILTPLIFKDQLFLAESFQDSMSGALHRINLQDIDIDLENSQPFLNGNNKYQGFGVSLSVGNFDGDKELDLIVGCLSPDGILETDFESLSGAVKIFYNFESFLGSGVEVKTPTQFQLFQNYPNPFNPETRINYSIAKSGNVKVMIYNMLGQKIITLIDEQKTTGHYSVNFNAENLESGIYFYRLTTNNYIKSKRMVLMK